jgi:hypothetical protein
MRLPENSPRWGNEVQGTNVCLPLELAFKDRLTKLAFNPIAQRPFLRIASSPGGSLRER